MNTGAVSPLVNLRRDTSNGRVPDRSRGPGNACRLERPDGPPSGLDPHSDLRRDGWVLARRAEERLVLMSTRTYRVTWWVLFTVWIFAVFTSAVLDYVVKAW